jgi:hypothetical protein
MNTVAFTISIEDVHNELAHATMQLEPWQVSIGSIWRALMNASVFDRISLVEYPDRQYPPKPTPSVLDAFEIANSIKLPESFRQFAQKFGTGELTDHFRIFVPMEGTDDEQVKWGLRAFNNKMRAGGWLDDLKPHEIASRLFFFGSTIGGLAYAWDPGAPRDATRHEYPVYEVRHEISKVASTFEEFIESYCLDKYWGGDDEAEIHWKFVRYGKSS